MSPRSTRCPTWILSAALLAAVSMCALDTRAQSPPTDPPEAVLQSLTDLEQWLRSLPPTERQAAKLWLINKLETQTEVAEPDPGSKRPSPDPKSAASEPAPTEQAAIKSAANEPRPAKVDKVPPQPSQPLRRASEVALSEMIAAFDSNGDGTLSGLDRYWRHVYLWTDRDGSGTPDPREMVSPFERGVREISVSLRAFERGKKKRKRELDILIEDFVLLDLEGNGWSGLLPTDDNGALAIDASAIAEDGGPRLVDAKGQSIQGIQPIVKGWRIAPTS